jgi:nicotinate (nicotinamide) nucleotide adenylyltransferase
MGGTFDPVHNGHLVAASEVADLFDLDQVVFVPTGQPWQKDRDVTPAEDRYLMTVIATASNPRFSVSRVDIDRGGPTYTRDTLRELGSLNPDADLYFITGADALASILSWQDWKEMFALARFVGVSRPGYELDGEHIAAALKDEADDALTLVEVPALAISSTDCIRNDRLRRSHHDGDGCRAGGVVETRRGCRRHRRVRPAGDHRLLCDRVGVQRAAGQRDRRRGGGENAAGRLQTGSQGRRPRRSLDPAGLRRHRRAHPAPGRAQLLCPGPAMAGLPGCPHRPRRAGVVMIRRLVMLRHGQTEFNAGNRMQGQLDTDLSDLGRDQAVAVAEALAKRQPLLIVSSDLRRALDTAESLGERSGQPVEVDARLRETHLGDWQGLTHIEVDAAAPGARIAWRNDARWAPHGGESRVDVAERGMPLIRELISDQTDWGTDEPERPVVLVAHGGLIAALTAALLKLPVDNWPALGGMGNASWVQLSGHSDDDAEFDDIRWRLDVWNASAQVAGDVL